MHSDGQLADAAAEGLLKPPYWLVSGLEWRGDDSGASEAAVAVAPGMIPRGSLGHDAFQVLGCADLYARKHAERVVLFSDLTRMFAAAGTSWSQLGVDWESALAELRDGPFPAMLLSISERAHLFICDPVTRVMALTPGRADDARELVRQAIGRQLTADWPAYIQRIIDADRISLAR